MLYIEQTENGANIRVGGDLPTLICDLSVLYRIIVNRGAVAGINVPRLLDLVSDDKFVERLVAECCQESE